MIYRSPFSGRNTDNIQVTSWLSSFSEFATLSLFGAPPGLCIWRSRIRLTAGKTSESQYDIAWYYCQYLSLRVRLSLIQENETFRDIVISLAATYGAFLTENSVYITNALLSGLYFISSFMHFEPWHMFTSFAQYMFYLPSCTFKITASLLSYLTCVHRRQHPHDVRNVQFA